MPAVRSPKRSPAKKAKARSYKVTNLDLTTVAWLDDGAQDGGSISMDVIVEKVKTAGLELDSPRGKRCAIYVIRSVLDFKRRGLLEEDPGSSDESDVKYRLTEKGLRKYRNALMELKEPDVFASTREKIRFAQDLRQLIFPPPELVIEKLYRKVRKLERFNGHLPTIDTDDESDDMDVEGDDAASIGDGNADITLVEGSDEVAAPIASTSRVTLDGRVTPPPPQPLSAHSSYNEQHLLSPPLSDDSDNESQFTPTPRSQYTPPIQAADFDVFDMPGSYGSINGLDVVDNDAMGEGDITMVDPQVDLLAAVNEKLIDLREKEPVPEYMDQGVGTPSVTYADVAVQAADATPYRSLALRLCAKYVMAIRTIANREVRIEALRAGAKAAVQDLRLENAELREHVADQAAIIEHLEVQRAEEAETHQIGLAQRDEWVTDAIEGQAVLHAELKDKVGMFELLKEKYEAAMVKVSRFQGALGGIMGIQGSVADIMPTD